MELLKYLRNGVILVVPEVQKQRILEEIDTMDELMNVKILSLDEFRRKYYFDYDKETLIYFTKKYGIKIDVSKVYLSNMYQLNGLYTSSDKLNELTLMKNNLLDHNLLKRDPFFVESLKHRPIFFYGYDYYLKEDMKLINELRDITDVQVFQPVENSFRRLVVHEFLTIDEEVEYVFSSICQLLKQGVSCNQIKLSGVSSEYEEVLLRFAKLYHLPLSLQSKVSIYETLMGKKVLSYLKEGYDFYDILTFIDKEFQDLEFNRIITNLFNQYVFFKEEKSNILDFIEDDMKHSYLEVPRYREEIEIISLENNQIGEENYVFVLGFNNGNFPVIQKDEEFIGDSLKEELQLTTSTEKNKLSKKALMNHLFAIQHLVITYKLSTAFDGYYPSTLITDFDMEVVREHESQEIHYSRDFDVLKLTEMLDSYIQYGVKHPDLEKYFNTLKIPYGSYKHQYTLIDSKKLHAFLNHKLLLSYSAMDRFYHCGFRYYLQDILKVTKYEPTLSIKIGNVFHAVLASAFLPDFDFDSVYDRELWQYELTKKEKFYFRRLKSELQLIIETIQEQNLLTGFSNGEYEKKIYVPQKGCIDVTFMGIVDKILWRENHGEKLVSIIDYKTGSTDLDLSMVPYGMKMQLPIYMYLVRQSQEFQNSQICGIYLQKILSSLPSNSSDVLHDKKEALKLRGYSIDREDLLEMWDSTYSNSEVIKSLRKGKNGWYHYAKLLSQEEILKLIELTSMKIEEAIDGILKGNFSIHPKRIDGENVGCEFCQFHDICFHKEQDFEDLEGFHDLSFLEQ